MSVLSRKKNRTLERAERKKFDAWAKQRSQQSPGDWVLTGGHDSEEHWAWEGWKGRAAEAAVLETPPRVETVLAAVDAYSRAAVAGDPVSTEAARQVMEAAVRRLAAAKRA